LSLYLYQAKEYSADSAIPGKLNLFLTALHVLLAVYQLFLLPIYLLPLSLGWGVTLVPIAALSNPFWSLIHEAIHDMLYPSPRLNRAAGRLLSILFGSPFRVLRLSHLLHHKLNRLPVEGTELYDSKKTSWIRASAGYYFQILGGLYFVEVISSVIAFLPRRVLWLLQARVFSEETLSAMLMKNLVKGESLREIRIDGTAILIAFASSAVCYGEHWPLFVAALLVRALLISFLDNVYHYGTPVNDVFYADTLWLPHLFSRALLYFNLHGIHHRNPAIPWIRLPEVFQREGARFDGSYFASAFRQLSGPMSLTELTSRRND
jgi:fatty acid desaturase